MKILLVGVAGVGNAITEIAAGRSFPRLTKMPISGGGHKFERDVLERPTS